MNFDVLCIRRNFNCECSLVFREKNIFDIQVNDHLAERVAASVKECDMDRK